MGETAKALGAYYTPRPLARRLCREAIRRPGDSAFDPSCGEGVFLAAAVERLLEIGAEPRQLPDQIAGVELNPSALARAHGALLSRHPALRWSRLVEEDFFSFARRHLGKLDFNAVVGNPPFIRYQKFRGRDRALELAARVGVRLSRESSSWAPFVAVASAFVRPGGRLAMVIPREAKCVNYARPLFDFLRARFGQVRIEPVEGLPFRALQKVCLLLAGGVPNPDEKQAPPPQDTPQEGHDCVRLSDIARVRLGIVTGAKEFFVLDRADRAHRKLSRHLVPVVSTPSQLRGLAVTKPETHLLLRVRTEPDEVLARYIAAGEAGGFARRYKCRIREPWYRVPEQEAPHAFLTYLSGEIPRMALNHAAARATNNLHGVWWNDRPDAWTLTFHNWLTLLSIERIGRVYGGGVLKVEPGDAPRILLPRSPVLTRALFARVDADLRRGDWVSAVNHVSERALPVGVRRRSRSEWKKLRAQR